MILKKNKLILIVISLVILLLLGIVIKGVYSYLQRYGDLEKGITISSFTQEDKNNLCKCFDIANNNSVTFHSLEYRVGLKNPNVDLQIKSENLKQLEDMLTNYEVRTDNVKYYWPPEISEQFYIYEQYENIKDRNIKAFLFTSFTNEEKLLLISSDRSNASLNRYIHKQMDDDNYEKTGDSSVSFSD